MQISIFIPNSTEECEASVTGIIRPSGTTSRYGFWPPRFRLAIGGGARPPWPWRSTWQRTGHYFPEATTKTFQPCIFVSRRPRPAGWSGSVKPGQGQSSPVKVSQGQSSPVNPFGRRKAGTCSTPFNAFYRMSPRGHALQGG
jgi:hypothetical protein